MYKLNFVKSSNLVNLKAFNAKFIHMHIRSYWKNKIISSQLKLGRH